MKMKQKRLLPKYFKKVDNKITDNIEIANYFNSFYKHMNLAKNNINKNIVII